MSLNESKGNMYDFVTHTFNTVKGECPHNCGYCYMKRWGKLNPPRLDESEFKTDLGADNFIFVGSSNDLFANEHPEEWIIRTLDYCDSFPDNRYLFQSKNPGRIIKYIEHPVFKRSVVCTTIESNRPHPVMRDSPLPYYRVEAMAYLSKYAKTYVTIEPVMKFDMSPMLRLIKMCNPEQVNVGADSGHNNLPEPTAAEVVDLIGELQKFTKINKKSNLNRLLK
ncbi:DNA repair photolyase [Dysgonomonas hofstadii]|uniref:DNA repair photolyase n=1 Tax=Dysgonomonas hofstadii TaxID=637886 RepID=A0A840CKR8_9BACT|nr:hypothetical protein [Dysgonomonas hofstadii]MBB4036580.1 DNA repair photolyase [Dysgonomonas hofstadii]